MDAFLDSFTCLLKDRLKYDRPMSASNMTTKVQAPKNFQVNQNFWIWLGRFDNYATLARIPANEKREQLLSRLDHQAYVAVTNLHLSPGLSHAGFCVAVTRRFYNVTREDYKLQLKSTTQNHQRLLKVLQTVYRSWL
jgi:hypothetical protein